MIEDESQCQNKVMVINIFQKLLEYTSRHCCRNLSEKLYTVQQDHNHSIAMRSCLIKSNFKFSLQKDHFVYFFEVIIKCFLNFIKSKESCKEKFDSNNNWKTAWLRAILEWHLFLRLLLGFVWKMLSFVGKHLSFYSKDVCSLYVFLYV